MVYDVIVVGGGINGLLSAYMLQKSGKKVLVLEKGEVASGGSGAAGAFLSPKFSKKGELKELLGSALEYALEFYEEHFPLHVKRYPLVHIAKNEKEAEVLEYVKAHDKLPLLENPPFTPANNFIFTSKSAVADAKNICFALAEELEVERVSVEAINREDDAWLINTAYRTHNVVLATGAYENRFFSHPYEMIRGIWGHRIDVKTSTDNGVSIHQYVSISAKRGDVLSIGATHNVHYHPQKSAEPYDVAQGREELLQMANKTLSIQDAQVVADYIGLRSGSFDYLPIVGGVVDVEATLSKLSHEEIYTKHPDFTKAENYSGVYQINGSAGYGFVLAPYLASVLCEHIVSNEAVPEALHPARFFFRWAKKRN